MDNNNNNVGGDIPADKPKSKSRTSSAVKRKYNNAHYALFQSWIDKSLNAELCDYIQTQGWSKAEFLRNAFDALKKSEKT